MSNPSKTRRFQAAQANLIKMFAETFNVSYTKLAPILGVDSKTTYNVVKGLGAYAAAKLQTEATAETASDVEPRKVNTRRKLSDSDVRAIRQAGSRGVAGTTTKLATIYGVDSRVIDAVIKGQTYRDVK